MNSPATKLKVLLLQMEFPKWRKARHWSYTVQLALEEGLKAHGVECFTITTPWLSRARQLCQGKKFDQVWIEIVHQPLDEELLEWISSLAPVRLGLVGESLEYSAEECRLSTVFAPRKALVCGRLRHLTHVLAVDEHDVEQINSQRLASAMWWPQAVPERFVIKGDPSVPSQAAFICGAMYGARVGWFNHPDLKSLFAKQRSPEAGTLYPFLFNALHAIVAHNPRWMGGREVIGLEAYLSALRHLRERCFARWLQGMRSGCAVVNLPSCVKAYAGRVVESMAAGVPVVSWEIPNRPRTKALFENGSEIVLYSGDDPAELAAHIRRIRVEPQFSRRLADSARRKLMRFHTTEQRVREVLHWLGSGAVPTYN